MHWAATSLRLRSIMLTGRTSSLKPARDRDSSGFLHLHELLAVRETWTVTLINTIDYPLTRDTSGRRIGLDMAFRVPQQYLIHIQSLLEMPDERLHAFLDALVNTGPKFNIFDLAADISTRAKIPRRIAEGVVQVLANLYTIREGQDIPLETFLDEQVGPALKNHLVARPDSADPADSAHADARSAEIEIRWEKLKKFLTVALPLDDTVGTAAKAGPVLTEHERIFEDARILTDIRPIFHPDLSEKPHAAVIVHMLRITSRDILGNRRAQYVALDSNDIRVFKQLMDRAIKKEETLKAAMNGSGINIVEPKGIF